MGICDSLLLPGLIGECPESSMAESITCMAMGRVLADYTLLEIAVGTIPAQRDLVV